MGFPIYSLAILLSTLLDQSGPKQRVVSQVYSPSCNSENCSELSHELSIYFSQNDLLGITLFSATNGHSIMFPVSWTNRDKVAWLLKSVIVLEK